MHGIVPFFKILMSIFFHAGKWQKCQCSFNVGANVVNKLNIIKYRNSGINKKVLGIVSKSIFAVLLTSTVC